MKRQQQHIILVKEQRNCSKKKAKTRKNQWKKCKQDKKVLKATIIKMNNDRLIANK